ncbi:sensor histidine kinase [Cellulomonas sp. SG140]|uniref:sensor histidine kinase n=1 Tax=Cellulomonas sp. SG140 TaxID=2976536 RepID=UPI0021E87D40|nr:HAMP domain-containing sensor histidine kinase [Cellulomonas sp. SG140]
MNRVRLPRRWTAAWDRVPLRGRLVAVATVLIAVGLVLAGITSTALLQRSLVAQIDDKLRTEGKALASQRITALVNGLHQASGPSDYYVRLQVEGAQSFVWGSQSVADAYGEPNVPDLTVDQAAALDARPFTVKSSVPGSHWRVVAFTTSDGTGTVLVALPLGEARDTTSTMVSVLLLSGVGIVLLGGLAAGWAVRRSLAPLGRIEETAAAIAAGDLSRRVRTAPESTEVGRLGVALNGMLTQIEAAFDARTASETRMRRFVADASHELRTPLATIRGYAELYRMGALTGADQVDDTMRRIEGSATRMGTLVEDLLALARLDEGRPIAHQPVDLTVLAADAISDLRALDPDRPARLAPLDPSGTARATVVLGDDARLRQVVANLVGNVVQHTPAGTPVEIAVGTAPGVGIIEVRDHGPGIDPEHAARVFERFYRVDASRTRESGGAGLGMAIVAAIVSAHSGQVTLAQTPGGGTTVRVVLPAAPAGPVPHEVEVEVEEQDDTDVPHVPAVAERTGRTAVTRDDAPAPDPAPEGDPSDRPREAADRA